MRILISHVYSSDNKGDAALTSVLIQDLRRVFPDATVTILRLEATDKLGLFEGVPEKPSFMHYAVSRYKNPVLKLLYTIYMLSATSLWAICMRVFAWHVYLPPHLRKVAVLYERADLIVAVGGGYIRSRKGFANRLNIPLLLHPLLFAFVLKKPTALYSQSVGPFVNSYEPALVAFVLKRMLLVLVREDTSLKLLAHMGVTNNVVRAVDSGFLLQTTRKVNIRKTYHIPADKIIVGVTVRAWLNDDAQQKYERSVAQSLDTIIDHFHVHVIFIPQVTAAKGDDDRVASRRVHHFMRHAAQATTVTTPLDHLYIKAMYNELDVLLGTRFHSVIFSLTSYVPVLAIEYEHKTSGIMHDLHLQQWVVKIEDIKAAKLAELLQKLLQERAAYQAHLHQYLPQYVQRARHTADVLAEYYGLLTQQGAQAKQLQRNQNLE